jgi:hypothetical protein
VLEAGSLNLNGSAKIFFDDSEYIGVDAKNGEDVDWWGVFHEYKEKPFGYFDIVVTTETLEHDPFWRITLKHMIDMIKLEGTLMISCAGPARGPHGTAYWQDPNDPKYVSHEYHPLGPERDYYWNIKPEILLYELVYMSGWRSIEYDSYRNGSDICIVAIGKYRQQVNYARGQVALLRKYEKTKL